MPEAPASKIPPTLIAALVADAGVVDPTSKKKTLVGIFDRIFVKTFPAERPVTLYFRLTDGEGRYPIKIKFLLLGKEELLVAQIEGGLNLKDRRHSVDFLLPMPPLPFPEPGRYEFRLFASDMHVGGLCIDVAAIEDSKSEDPK